MDEVHSLTSEFVNQLSFIMQSTFILIFKFLY